MLICLQEWPVASINVHTVWYASGMPNPEAWDLAGFTDMRGRLGKPVLPSGFLWAPGTVEIDPPFLIWNQQPGWRISRPPDDILDRFVRLSSGNAEDVRQFVRKYGPLLTVEDETGTRSLDWTAEGKESVADWQSFSRKARAFLNIASALSHNQVREDTDWKYVNSWLSGLRSPLPTAARFMTDDGWNNIMNGLSSDPIFLERMLLQRALADWHRAARITFTLDSVFILGRAPRMEVSYGGRVFSAIVLQLLLTITKSESLYICSGCGWPYLRPRGLKKPNPGESNFCQSQSCGRPESVRQSGLRRRQKKGK